MSLPEMNTSGSRSCVLEMYRVCAEPVVTRGPEWGGKSAQGVFYFPRRPIAPAGALVKARENHVAAMRPSANA